MAGSAFAELSENAMVVLERRYLLRDATGRPTEGPDELFRRVARCVAAVNSLYDDDRSVEQEEEEFFLAMRRLEFLPNSPTLMNAGTDTQQLAACFVLPVEDSIEGIYDAIKWAAIIHQTGGGTGFSFSRLRPAGDLVRSTVGVASGPVSFMRVFDAATEAIKQGGRRRGASMGILRVDHPDIDVFIHAKDDLRSLTNFNLSVGATDEFIERARKGEDYDLVNPRNMTKVERRSAAKVLEDVCRGAWLTGDPGVVFLDHINRANPTPGMGEIESTNPCGEVPLLPFEACNLGSVNLDRMLVERGGAFEVDWARLGAVVDMGVRFLDNVIDVSRYPLPQIEKMARGNRKIGLGVMGFANALVRMGVRYGSVESMRIAQDLISYIRRHADETSRRIGEERGDFPNIELSVHKSPRRNATVLSIAPTGTISMIASCSSGIEPLYALSYVKHVMDGAHLREIHPYFLELARKRGFDDERLQDILAASRSIKDLRSVPQDVRDVFVIAYDVTPEEHVRMQAVFQENVDNAVSKTVNLPPDSTWEDIRSVYLLAHHLGCKGITVFREGSRPAQVLTAGTTYGSCPDCGSSLRLEEDALVCPACGYAIG